MTLCRLRGRLSPAAAACKALDEVTVLYSWDRPALFSPIKSVRKTDLRFGNAVFLVTSLPDTLDDLQLFLGGSKTNINIKPRHVAENLLSKRTASHFTGELNISLHILNTRSRQHDDRIVQVQLRLALCLYRLIWSIAGLRQGSEGSEGRSGSAVQPLLSVSQTSLSRQ